MSNNKSSFKKDEKPYRLTKEGFEKLQEKERITKENLFNVLSRKEETARTCGDLWHDNPTLYQLESEERSLRRRLGEIQEKLKKAIVVEDNNHENSEFGIGSFFEIKFPDGEKMSFVITDPESGDISKGLISCEAPLVKAVHGAEEGNEVSYKVNEKDLKVFLLKKQNGGKV